MRTIYSIKEKGQLNEIKAGQTGHGLLVEHDGHVIAKKDTIQQIKEDIENGHMFVIPDDFIVSAVFQKYGIINANGRIYLSELIFRKKKLMWLSFLQTDWQKPLLECSTSSRQPCLAIGSWSSGLSRIPAVSTRPCGSSVARTRATTARDCATSSTVKATTCGLRTQRASKTHLVLDD